MDGASSSSWSTPPSTGRWTYHVFLSFRGEDTRNNFVDHLYAALDRAGIYTFKDDEKLQRGKSIAPELIKAIQESMVAVVVFSKNYANSSWCLEELNKIMECHDIMGQKVLPVFYDVDPSDVRGQKRSFETAFQQHEVKFTDDFEKVKKWRETLETAASLSGWDVPRTASGREAECINQIVRTILSYIGFRPDFHLIGMESCIRHDLVLQTTPGDCTTYTLCFIPSVLSTISNFDHNINRTTIIELCKISSIVPRGDALPIQVRIIRKWQPYLRKKDTFYLLIDIHGDAIEAIVHHLDNDYFENKIKVNSCYELNDYICDKAALSMKVADHPACLRLGKATSMLPVASPPGFPLHYFNLCSYSNLHSKIGNKNIVTDYAARLDNATPDRTKNGTPVIRLKLTDISGENIEATIWPEEMPRFDWNTMAKAETPIVLTLTSTSVGMFHGRTNLSSTHATYIYFNAETHEIISLRNRFETNSNQILPPQPRLPNKEEEIQVKSKISDLLQHKLDHGQNKTFTCDILIEKLINGRKWYCQLCPECRRNVYPYKGNWSCGTHHRIVEPKFMYCVGVVVSDTTGSTTATLFDNVVVSLLGMQCKELVIEKGFEAKEIIPEPLQALKNRRATLRLQYTAGSYDFKVNHASIPQSDLQLIDNAPPSTITTTSKVDKPTSSASQQLGANCFLIHRSRQHQEAKELKPNEVVINT